MDATDDKPFGVLFLKLRNVFNMRGDKADVREAMQEYFRVLRHFSLRQVEAAADAWVTRWTRFPKPAEWLDAIPRQQAAGLYPMPEDEALAFLHAQREGWEDEPCGCHDCRLAGVTHRMLRYVPDTDVDDRDVRMALGDRVVTRGHWAHGTELARFYAARDAFMALKAKVWAKLMKSMPKVNESA